MIALLIASLVVGTTISLPSPTSVDLPDDVPVKHRYLVVDKGMRPQRMFVYACSRPPFVFKGRKMVKNNFDKKWVLYSCKTSTGKPGYTTPSGVFRMRKNPGDRPGSALKKYGGSLLHNQIHMDGSGGCSIHIYKSVPGYPASHGCVRMFRKSSEVIYPWFFTGNNVYVVESVSQRPQ